MVVSKLRVWSLGFRVWGLPRIRVYGGLGFGVYLSPMLMTLEGSSLDTTASLVLFSCSGPIIAYGFKSGVSFRDDEFSITVERTVAKGVSDELEGFCGLGALSVISSTPSGF